MGAVCAGGCGHPPLRKGLWRIVGDDAHIVPRKGYEFADSLDINTTRWDAYRRGRVSRPKWLRCRTVLLGTGDPSPTFVIKPFAQPAGPNCRDSRLRLSVKRLRICRSPGAKPAFSAGTAHCPFPTRKSIVGLKIFLIFLKKRLYKWPKIWYKIIANRNCYY